jgi:glycosyltransferase involved in cell wall biosynthesis
MAHIAVVAPVYRAEAFIRELQTRLARALEPLTFDYEIIFIEDGGGDGSWAIIEESARADRRIKGIRLSRNFGQHAAIAAGIDRVAADWVVVMDCDLQDLPEEIPRLYAHALKGFDIVRARRVGRRHSLFRRAASRLFYAALGYLTETRQDPATANFGVYSRKAIEALRATRESVRYFPVMIQWVGFRSDSLDVEHGERARGSSSYDLGKLLRLAFNVMISFSERPLRLVVKLGLALSSFSFIAALILFVRAVLVRQVVPGWSSVMVSIWFLSGLIIFLLGVVGIYVGKTFELAKRKPPYIVDKTTET